MIHNLLMCEYINVKKSVCCRAFSVKNVFKINIKNGVVFHIFIFIFIFVFVSKISYLFYVATSESHKNKYFMKLQIMFLFVCFQAKNHGR